MKRILISTVLLSLLLNISGQTQLSTYQPGVTQEGAIYCLPKTAIRVTILVEKTTYKPGDLCKYAERYLRLNNVSPVPSESYALIDISEQAIAVADTTKIYAMKFDSKTSACNVALSDDGILLAINATPREQERVKPFVSSPRAATVNPRQYMSEEILAAGSTAKMAELTARDIYEIRESRNLLVRGQADNMPKDGEQLRLMLSQLDLQDRAMTSLFEGVTTIDTTEYSFVVAADKDTEQQILFRLSRQLGVVDADDLAGTPYYISITNLHSVPSPDPVIKKKGKQEQGVYVNIPGKMRSVVSTVTGELLNEELPAPQFGNTELLSGALFNKRYTTHLWLNPLTGAVDRLEAEQPR